MMTDDPTASRVWRQLRWVSRMLVAIVVAWAIVGAAIIVWAISHPVGVVLVASLVGNGLVWLVLSASLHRLLMRSFDRERALLVTLRYRERRGE